MQAMQAMAAENILKSREISTMLKQGFISDPSFSLSPSRIPTRPSPPPSFSSSTDKLRSSPTLFEMMSAEHQLHQHADSDRRRLQERVSKILADAPFQDPSWGGGVGDVKLTVSSKDGGFKTSMNVHRKVLAGRSRFFADKLGRRDAAHSVEICECDDVEVYVEAVVLMYREEEDLKRRLAKEEVAKVLGLLKVVVAIMFDVGIKACLEYLEAAPWTEDEEEKVISVLGQLQLHDPVIEILQRVSVEPSTSAGADGIFLHLLMGVLQAKDEKARREMKVLISGLLREDSTHHRGNNNKLGVSRDTLYHVCNKCLSSLLLCLSEVAGVDESKRGQGMLMGEIAREADNMQWVVEILIDKKMGDEFVKLWADQTELASLHSKIPAMYRYEISRITAQLCIAVGKGQIMVSKDTRFSLLCTWLEPLYDDFGWMKRACKSVDKKMVEDGLSQTILTLPLAQQQAILLNWFNRFLNKGDDCPNIQRAFEVWWRRAFVRRYSADQDHSHQLQIAVCDYPT
ncbi:BTB/POZ domain-containing protein At5g60050 [Magnolia sinica]|uniref:BTB/POZ domain-containing protein At5g60050 n=1 Tax=Magnolia sinica TaxID=86752 RepID=UPI00265B40EA|nr:BTB/POZ domain-containing protein At5g60050 [Magnolia sinica]XP_058093897.1 BTB/POZ domain-containing protein At5g60050 [Magnolia sinica]XP_058093898.1 BTB/POZ domain-containing protein At5g60050 [Magnolia sinica]XP_058093900.1 BTB/POZ domain-containing protein At5g60050 [Magnolia sinica]XP_058093901.1 BTB/POZ domain-containing protein At5g60050 [Magnolia sinica]